MARASRATAAAALALTLALAPRGARAANPLVPGVGQADPHIHFFNGSFWMFSTHDFAPNNTNFLMKDWRVWESPDLVNWTLASTLAPQGTAAPPAA
jgi:arabinoxylan arabinofuranohydrolase